jgi:hypothetical protein
MEATFLTSEQWKEFDENGFLILTSLLQPLELEQLNKRLDDIMLGKVLYPSLLMQIDPSAPINRTSSSSSSPPTSGKSDDSYTLSNVEVAGQTLGFK